jgi:hypothetical protein
MDKMDHLANERLADQLVTPERVEKILSSLLQRQPRSPMSCGQMY